MTLRDKIIQISISVLLCSSLAACSASERIANIGKMPEVSTISNPTTERGYQPVSMPMPAPQNVLVEKNSLWAADRQTFFKDQRAADVGDIITVLIDIRDEAVLENQTQRLRTGQEQNSVPNLLGLESQLAKVLPEAVDPANIATSNMNSQHIGTGNIRRRDEIELQLAALVTQVLPNGNMVIQGQQELIVNFEKRKLGINGVIRPQDISVNNTVSYQQIAEARITYGGEGQITDIQQPRYGQQLYDIIFPF